MRPLFLEREKRPSRAPSHSYWAQLPPDGFTRWVAANRLEDMRASGFGDPVAHLITDPTLGETAGSKLHQAAKWQGYRTLGKAIT